MEFRIRMLKNGAPALLAGILLAGPAVAPAQEAAPDQIVVTIERQILTARDLDPWVVEAALFEPALLEVPRETARKVVLPEAAEEVLLGGWAETQLQQPVPEVIAAAAEQIQARQASLAGSAANLRDHVESAGLEMREYLRWLQESAGRRLTAREALRLRANIPAESPVPTVARADRVRLSHIYVHGLTMAALEKALRVRRDLAAGLAFADAARIYSEDPATAERGGDLGWLGRQEVAPALWDAVAPLQLGAPSQPVKGTNGYHIVAATDAETAEMEAYAEALLKARQEVLDDLRAEYVIRSAPGWEVDWLEEAAAPEEGLADGP